MSVITTSGRVARHRGEQALVAVDRGHQLHVVVLADEGAVTPRRTRALSSARATRIVPVANAVVMGASARLRDRGPIVAPPHPGRIRQGP